MDPRMKAKKAASAGDTLAYGTDATKFVEVADDDSVPEVTTGEFYETIYAQSDAKGILIELNSRLANYIEKVRSLETENAKLLLKMREVELVQKQKKESNVVFNKQQYEDLRVQLEDINAARVRSEVDLKKFESLTEDLRSTYDRNAGNLNSILDDRIKLQHRLDSVRNELNLTEVNLRNVERDSAETKKNLAVVSNQNHELKVRLGDESTLRTELQGRIENELNTYSHLLDGEEVRLNMDKQDSSSSADTFRTTTYSSKVVKKAVPTHVVRSSSSVRPAPIVPRTQTPRKLHPLASSPKPEYRLKRARPEHFFDFDDSVEDKSRSWIERVFNL